MKRFLLLSLIGIAGCSRSQQNTTPAAVLVTPPPVSASGISSAAEVDSLLSEELKKSQTQGNGDRGVQMMCAKYIDILDNATTTEATGAVKNHAATMRNQLSSFSSGMPTDADTKNRGEAITSCLRWVEVAADEKGKMVGGHGLLASGNGGYEKAKSQVMGFAAKIDAFPTATPLPTF